MVTDDELVGLEVARDVAKGAELTDGRGFFNGRLEVQIATVSGDPTAAAQADELAALGHRLIEAGVARAAGLPELPEVVSLPAPRQSTPLRCPLGVADLTLDTVEIDIGHQNLVVTGPRLSDARPPWPSSPRVW